jgi:hypothetical protein
LEEILGSMFYFGRELPEGKHQHEGSRIHFMYTRLNFGEGQSLKRSCDMARTNEVERMEFEKEDGD